MPCSSTVRVLFDRVPHNACAFSIAPHVIENCFDLHKNGLVLGGGGGGVGGV